MKAIIIIKKHAIEIDMLLGENYIVQLISMYNTLQNEPNDFQKELKIEKYFHFFESMTNKVDVLLFEAAGMEVDIEKLDKLQIPTNHFEVYEFIKKFLENDIEDSFRSACEFTIVFNTFVKLVYPYVTFDENDI
jgi:hypothetical protein